VFAIGLAGFSNYPHRKAAAPRKKSHLIFRALPAPTSYLVRRARRGVCGGRFQSPMVASRPERANLERAYRVKLGFNRSV
jgi:hypothetical protein